MSPLLATAGDRRIALICATFPIRIDLGNPSHVSGGEGGTAGPARPSKRYCAAQFFELRRAAIHAVAGRFLTMLLIVFIILFKFFQPIEVLAIRVVLIPAIAAEHVMYFHRSTRRTFHRPDLQRN